MEKHGAIEPGVTPPEHEDTQAITTSKEATARPAARDAAAQASALDNDFRKNAAEAARKSL